MKVLILGGTAEARALAAEISERTVFAVVSSLAGRVRDPALPVGTVRIGGFGGVEGLRDYLRTERIDAVVDATHPFAATITANAEQACQEIGIPRVAVRRPPWTAELGEWYRVSTIRYAPEWIEALDPMGRVFLTTGRRDLDVFAGDSTREYLVRTVDQPCGAAPPRMRLILARGPYTVSGERELMIEQQVGLLVTKDSGGSMTSAKLTAAAQLGIPVLIVDRPALPRGTRSVATVAEVVQWLMSLAESGFRQASSW